VRLGGITAAIVVIWLLIGALAAGQRGYFSGPDANCAKTSTIVVTMLAGPLNYLGVNPKISCPRPSP
jgi:membrane protein YdbS with pleckstrin-like domain